MSINLFKNAIVICGLFTNCSSDNVVVGMITLFSAIIQTTNTSGNSKLNMATGWIWLARILNMPPRQITSLTLITFLEVLKTAIILKR